jgi:UDP-N-acetylglucosamine diphosphorylase / glucose-1-phosphate thymidylyltransferase / UDP-N-acetylgalactosamine diphosphorylase / glucosamine-1-phosphate N-acetyltransferase / galactosamine-1-phosphate N-acetyltransferase
MSELRIVLFEDEQAQRWHPFALTRPVGELRLGAWTFRERAELAFGGRCIGHLAGEHLAGFDEPGCAPAIDAAGITGASPVLYLCARARPDAKPADALPQRTGPVHVGGRLAGWYSHAGEPLPERVRTRLEHDAAAVHAATGALIENAWDLVAANPDTLRADFDAAGGSAAKLPAGVAAIGEPRLRLGRDVVVEPNVVMDFTDGPIWLGDGVRVRAFSRLAGPIHAAAGATLLGGSYTAVSIGPKCKIRGEIEESIVLACSNKAHDGFLGHAYLGAWVNLGAMTTNSDLKNNYGRIRIWTPDGDADTGTIKLGCLLGDHVKTGIGVLINTGTVIGAASNIWGAVLPPKYVAPFSWGSGEELGTYDVDRFLETAAVVMKRRDVELTDGVRQVLRRAFERRDA